VVFIVFVAVHMVNESFIVVVVVSNVVLALFVVIDHIIFSCGQ